MLTISDVIRNSSHYPIQKNLNKAQGVPLIGPFVVSPIKATISAIQITAGTVGLFVFGLLSLFSQNATVEKLLNESFLATGAGAMGITYSVSNILTLGYLAYTLEQNQ